MSLLSDLPDDILNLISIRLNGFDNCSLWMASDSKLRQRLVNNVITDFDIKYTIPGRYLWPGNFLKKLSKLSRLSLVVDDDLHHIPIQNVEIFAIPTLKYLNFSFTNFSDPFERRRLISLFESDLSVDFLRCLPSNLKTLLIPQNYFKLDMQHPPNDLNSIIEMIPRTLTKLDTRFYDPYGNKASLDLSKLPPHLTSLTTNASLDDQTYPMIPKTLKSLVMSNHTYNIAKLSPYLPTGLESLNIPIDQNPPTSQMFYHLKNLENLSLEPDEVVKLDDLVRKSPSKLKSFSCNCLSLTDVSVPSSLFNSCLTRLVLSNVIGISAELISSLPQTLTDLTISQFLVRDEPFAYFGLLPKNLKSLFTNLNIIENMSLLPESLTFLRLSALKSCDPSCFDRLPPKLESLEIEQCLPRSIMIQLPASLIELYVYSHEAVVDDEVVRMLPRGLKRLSFDGPDNITDAGAGHLPRSLAILTLSCNKNITDNGIALLPRNLMHLTLPQNSNFTDECVKHLPRKLSGLYMDEAKKITSNSCKDLPKYLQILSLSECHDWDSEKLIESKNELPPFMRRVNLGNEEASMTWQRIIKEASQ